MKKLLSFIFFFVLGSLAVDEPHVLQEIEDQRHQFQLRGNNLQIEKNSALREDPALSTLHPTFDSRLLHLIEDIIAHNQTVNGRVDVSLERKREWSGRDVSNISMSSGLLTANFRNYYNNNRAGYQNSNLWADLTYLAKFFDGTNDPTFVPLYHMTGEQAFDLMNSQSMVSLRGICSLERQGFSLAVRTHYRNNQNLEELYLFVQPQREKQLLDSVNLSLTHLIDLYPIGHLHPNHQRLGYDALQRALLQLGEMSTKKNLSPRTKSLWAHLPLADNVPGGWQDFIRIRNKLAHSEWDIHSRNLINYMTQHDFREFGDFCRFMVRNLSLIRNHLEGLNDVAQLQGHYLSTDPLPPVMGFEPVSDFLDPLASMLAALPHTRNSMNADRHNHAESFSLPVLIDRIEHEEIVRLRQILAVEGSESINDPHPENTQLVTGVEGDLFPILRQQTPAGYALNSLNQSIVFIEEFAVYRQEPIKLNLPENLLVVLQNNVGIHAQQQVNLTPQQIVQLVTPRYQEFYDSIVRWGRHCRLSQSLLMEPWRIGAAFTHFGRIGKYVNELAPHLPDMTEAEFRTLRNFAQHGSDIVDAGPIPPHDFLIKYSHQLIHELLPFLRNLVP